MNVAWVSYFPIEWLPDLPEGIRESPRGHPASWQRVLVDEFRTKPGLKLHVFSVRIFFKRTCHFERDGVTYHCLAMPRALRATTLFWWETWMLRRELKAIKPDLVHAWGSERGAALVASRLGYPYLVTMQGILEWISQYVQLGFRDRLETRLERVSLRRASVATTESSFSVRWLQEHYPHLDVRQVEHAPNRIFHQLERRPETSPVHFLYVAVPSMLKGADLLLLALDKLLTEVDFRLTIIASHGVGTFFNQMKGQTSPSLWERIILRHGLSQLEVSEVMARATIVLFPTRVDNSPNSIKEAVVAGVPVVASAVGGITDYILPGQNGFTFPSGSLEDLLKCIRAALAHPLFNQGKVEPGTMRKMRDYLSARTMGDKFLAVYQRVLADSKSKHPVL